jgi:hypothetical protein
MRNSYRNEGGFQVNTSYIHIELVVKELREKIVH